jgi:ribosome recycling factor
MKEQPAPTTQQKTVKDVENSAKSKMESVLADLQHAMSSIRTGRASVNLLDSVRVDYFGTPTPVNQVGTLHVPEPFMITIAPWDSSLIGPIEKAIRNSELGLNPSNDGKLIRVPIPQLTEERRKEFVKKLHHVAEEHRVSLRNVRRDANEQVKKLLKDKAISEDEDRRAHEDIQKMVDSYIGKLDAAAKAKEKDILEVK